MQAADSKIPEIYSAPELRDLMAGLDRCCWDIDTVSKIKFLPLADRRLMDLVAVQLLRPAGATN